MEQLFPFIVSNLFLLVFYSIYHFFLKNETFHNPNRFYLIFSSLLAIGVPWLDLQVVYAWLAPIKEKPVYELISGNEIEIVSQKTNQIFSFAVVQKIYFSISLLFILRTVFFFVKALRLKSNAKFKSQNAFSFLGKIFIDPWLDNQYTLTEHEETHRRQLHFFDLIFFEFIKAVFWINPASYWLSKQIRIVHEFLADHVASQTMESRHDYSVMLLSRHFGIETSNPFVQSFYKKSTLKQRISMLAKDPSHYFAQFKYLIFLPAFFIMLFASSFTWLKNIPERLEKITITMEPVTFNNTGNPGLKVPTISKGKLFEPDTTQPEEIFTATEVLPQYEGGQVGLYRFLAENIKYPKEAQLNNISGRVFVKFVIKKDGSIGEVNILKGIGFGCDEEAVRVIKMLKNWKPATQNGKPVNIYYNMPVVFKLDNDDNANSNLGNNSDNTSLVKFAQRDKPFELKIAGNDYNDALIYVNDVEIIDRKINDLDPASIESVSVIKGNTAVLTYGERAKNGVILIKTKK